jgi:hypothetical protein
MEDLPERLRSLTEKKYFAVIAVIFFAFVTALIFALLAQQVTVQNVDQLRTEIKTGTNSSGSLNGGIVNQEKPQTLLDRVVSRISGKSVKNTRTNITSPSQGGNNDQGDNTVSTGKKVTSGTTIPSQDQKELLEKINREALPIPKVVVKDYVLRTALPNTPSELKIYKLKTTYSQSDIASMAQTLGLSPLSSSSVVIEKNKAGLTQIFDLQNKLYLAVNNQTGTVMFSANNAIRQAATGDYKQDALALARSLGYAQPCLQATDTYTKKSNPQSTYVDIHCEWQTTGAPIVSYFGILNLPVNEALKDISLGAVPAAPRGDDFRPTDFNTITVQYDKKTGGVLAFSSNILPVQSEINVPASNIVDATNGFDKLKGNQKQFAFAAPQGSGFTDLRNVYINNTAQAETVDVTDFVLAYPVVPGMKQEYLCPSWISRSQGRLESGYDGLFIESASAVNDSRCGKTAVLGATTIAQNVLPNPVPTVIDAGSHGDTLQYKNFTVQGEASSCPIKDQFTNALKISDGVYIAWIDRGRPGREWWIAVTSEQQVAGALGDGTAIPNGVRSDYMEFRRTRAVKCDIGDRSDCPLSASVAGTFVACKYLTTGSPSLYITSSTPQQVEVKLDPVGGVSFAQPAFNIENGWNITTAANKRHYWEFNKLAVKNALEKESYNEAGYVVAKKDLISFFEQTVAPQAHLNAAQTSDLVGEVKREINSLRSAYVKIVLLPRAVLDRTLPVSLSPAPRDFYRYFFVLSGTDTKVSLPQPVFNPIVVSDYYAVETGTLILGDQ